MESESGQSDFATIDSTKRIVKYFSKCLIELIKHAESIQYKNNKLVNFDVSSTLNYDSCNEMDITEHNIKSEIQKDGPIFQKIERIKQCIVELLTICSQQNILIDYDTSKPHVAIYDAFDDSQRILVMNHLTLYILSLVENIYLSLKYFKSSKYMENGPQIRKTFSNIYKEMKTLPMRSDILENMDSSFKSLTPKSEYTDSYNYLVEKFDVLCKYVCKFNKSYSKKCGYTDLPPTEYSTDDDNSPRKKSKIIEKTYIKPENRINTTKTHESTFKIPSIENTYCLQNEPKQPDDTRKKKKKKVNTNMANENDDKCENLTDRDLLVNTLLNDSLNEMNKNANKDRSNKIKKTICLQNEPIVSDDTRKKKKNKVANENGEKCENSTDMDLLLNTLLNDSLNEININTEKNTSNEIKKTKNVSEDKMNNIIDSIEINKTEKRDEIIETNKKHSKKRKINGNNNIEGNIKSNTKKPKLTEKNTLNKPNKKPNKSPEINQELNEDELNDLLTNSCLFNDDSKASNENEDSIPAEILTAISNGNIEIDYDKKDMEEFTNIIKENDLNAHERFLYIQDLLDTANSKIAISDETQEKIRNLKILVDWEVPPAHLISTNLSSGPNEQDKVLLAQIPVTYGPFTNKEDETIRKNWKEFIEKHDLEDDPSPFMLLIINKKRLLSFTERRKFVQWMGRGLPHKALHSVFRRFKILFKPAVKRGRFTPEEDELILTYLSHIKREDNRQKYARLAPLIKRDRLQIERRFRVLKDAAKESSKTIYWNLELKEKFLKHLLEETQSTSVEDLRDLSINFEMYNLLGKLMNIKWTKLRVHWDFRMHTELFAMEPINTDLIKAKLITKFHELEYDDWKTVDWSQMTAMFKGIAKCYLWITLKNTIKEYAPDLRENLKGSIDHLYDVLLPTLNERLSKGTSKLSKRLRYENGTLTYYK